MFQGPYRFAARCCPSAARSVNASGSDTPGDDGVPSPSLPPASVPRPLVVELREAVAEHPRLEKA
jgi:hypothetical protein